MAYQEKTALLNIISTLLISVFYWLYIFQQYQVENFNETNILKFWGSAFLLLIVLSIVVNVITAVVLNVINTIATQEEEDPSFADERDQLIELKASRNTLYIFSTGFAIALSLLAFDLSISAMFVLLIGSGMTAEICGNASRLYFYRRGF